ncbi:hypothetical protein LOH54_03030 [Sulfurimonas sp. HSL-3221]|uniref:hypothetical protein n=1 Tax=Sulfurimonadaceae TaxID=2771471 RepID=UPI001E4B71EA|nr:hypothetical protein [Sulfurimonas sp. HSL-3221]UFS63105.1 hypothetical protein LOH54_03030 [Sulfurimonas sp. HSL-3221]
MIRKIALGLLLAVGPYIMAEENSFSSIFGVEAGYVETNYNAPGSAGTVSENVSTGYVGWKLGGEEGDVRFLLDGAIWHTDDYNYAGRIGGSLQYVYRPSKTFDLFFGADFGGANSVGRTNVNLYYGAEGGLDVALSGGWWLQAGGRYGDVDEGSDDQCLRDFSQLFLAVIYKFGES